MQVHSLVPPLSFRSAFSYRLGPCSLTTTRVKIRSCALQPRAPRRCKQADPNTLGVVYMEWFVVSSFSLVRVHVALRRSVRRRRWPTRPRRDRSSFLPPQTPAAFLPSFRLQTSTIHQIMSAILASSNCLPVELHLAILRALALDLVPPVAGDAAVGAKDVLSFDGGGRVTVGILSEEQRKAEERRTVEKRAEAQRTLKRCAEVCWTWSVSRRRSDLFSVCLSLP